MKSCICSCDALFSIIIILGLAKVNGNIIWGSNFIHECNDKTLEKEIAYAFEHGGKVMHFNFFYECRVLEFPQSNFNKIKKREMNGQAY